MILRQLCAAIAPIFSIGAIAAPQPADLSRLDHTNEDSKTYGS